MRTRFRVFCARPELLGGAFFGDFCDKKVWANTRKLRTQRAQELGGLNKMKQTVAFKMKLKPGFEEEYERRHAAIWPELSKLITESGVSDYSIFLDKDTNILFAVQKVSGSQGSQDLGKNPIVKKWWAYMADIMDTNPDQSPVTIPLQRVFHLD